MEIYAQVLKRRDRRRHGEAFDALMADAVPSAASIICLRLRPDPRMPHKRRSDRNVTSDLQSLFNNNLMFNDPAGPLRTPIRQPVRLHRHDLRRPADHGLGDRRRSHDL